MTPMPPALAIAIAMSDSVTVSMAADENGTLRVIPRVKRDVVSTSLGWTSEWRGVRRTSSKVRTMSLRTRDRSPAGSAPLMRESPLPDLSGLACFFDVDGRVVVAIAKGMALRGLRPEVTKLPAASQQISPKCELGPRCEPTARCGPCAVCCEPTPNRGYPAARS